MPCPALPGVHSQGHITRGTTVAFLPGTPGALRRPGNRSTNRFNHAAHYLPPEATMRTLPILIATCALGFTTGVLAQGSSLAPAPATSGAGAGKSVPHSDRSFIEDAAQGGHAEIEGSKLAQQKSKNADVKAFADQMITDHTKVGNELDGLASSKGVKAPTEPSMLQKAELKTLGALDGSKFDKMYADRIGVAAHESTVKKFRDASQNAKDPDVKAFAAKNLPALEHHLQMARDLKAKLDK